jgi:hypothetical protein
VAHIVDITERKRAEEERDRLFNLSLEGPARVARQDVHAARGQLFEPVFSTGWHELRFAGISENGGRESAAEIDVKAAPSAVWSLRRKSGDAFTDTTRQNASLLDVIEHRSFGRRSSH